MNSFPPETTGGLREIAQKSQERDVVRDPFLHEVRETPPGAGLHQQTHQHADHTESDEQSGDVDEGVHETGKRDAVKI